MLGQGQGLVVNAQAPPQPWHLSTNLRAAVVTSHPTVALALSQCVPGMFSPSFSSSSPQLNQPSTNTESFSHLHSAGHQLLVEKPKAPKKPVNKSANKLWIRFPVCADPCHRLGAGWIPPVITQDQFSAYFCCCGSRPAPGGSRSDKNLSSGPSSFIKIYLQSSEYEDTVARSWPG